MYLRDRWEGFDVTFRRTDIDILFEMQLNGECWQWQMGQPKAEPIPVYKLIYGLEAMIKVLAKETHAITEQETTQNHEEAGEADRVAPPSLSNTSTEL